MFSGTLYHVALFRTDVSKNVLPSSSGVLRLIVFQNCITVERLLLSLSIEGHWHLKMETVRSPKHQFEIVLHGTKSQKTSIVATEFVLCVGKWCGGRIPHHLIMPLVYRLCQCKETPVAPLLGTDSWETTRNYSKYRRRVVYRLRVDMSVVRI
jgi:hypothetical protein